jgi:hypothetical protein
VHPASASGGTEGNATLVATPVSHELPVAPCCLPPPDPSLHPELCSCPCPKKSGPCFEGHFWFNAEYLLWWLQEGPLTTPLLTTGPPATLGVLGQPGVTPLFGDSGLDYGEFSGGRFTVGIAHPTEIVGIEAVGLFLLRQDINFRVASDAAGNPVIARPFFAANRGVNNVELVAFPGAFSGDAEISSSSRVTGAEVNGLLALFGTCRFSMDVLAGFRYLNLDEELTIFKFSTILPNGISAINGFPLLSPSTTAVTDSFATRNQFYGGQLGVQTELRCCGLFLHLAGKCALGSTAQKLVINGETTATIDGAVTRTVPGGLLALESNIGTYHHQQLSFIPEVQATVGYQVCNCLRAYVGYNFLYWSDVARPGAQINRASNETRIPTSLIFGPLVGENQPLLNYQRSSVWMQGLYFGLALRY